MRLVGFAKNVFLMRHGCAETVSHPVAQSVLAATERPPLQGDGADLPSGYATLSPLDGLVSGLYDSPVQHRQCDKGTPGESRGRKATGPRLLRTPAPKPGSDATKDPTTA